MTAAAEVQAAQRALDVAQQHAKDERHADLVRQLETTTAQLTEQEGEYTELRARVLALRAKRTSLQNAMSELIGQEAEHHASRPRIADHLPDAPSVIKWRQAGAKLQVQRAAITKELFETQVVSQMDIDLAKLGTEITRLQFSQGNLLSALEALKGPQPFLSAITEAPKGGLSRVQWR